MSNVLTCRNLSKTYLQGDNETKVLQDLELEVASGELLAIVGSSGCGKSTFLHLAGALDTPSSGEVQLNGVNILGAGYADQHLPVQLNVLDVIFIVVSALAMSFIATLYPAYRASKTQPAEVLRNE